MIQVFVSLKQPAHQPQHNQQTIIINDKSDRTMSVKTVPTINNHKGENREK